MTEIAVAGTVQSDNGALLALTSQLAGDHDSVPLFVPAQLERVASAIMAERRDRYALFGEHLFADPAWDILLGLTIAESRQRRVTISQLCERVDVPTTTALRWIGNMTDEGLLIRRDDATDKRRKFIALSPNALTKMVQYCSRADTPSRLAA